MAIDEFARRVREVLTRANSLFGSASTATPAAASAQQLTAAAETLRQTVAPEMAGAAVSGYSTFAEAQASALGRLADTDDALNQVLERAATAENTAAATSRSAVNAVASRAEKLSPQAENTTGHQAVIAALQSDIARQQELVRQHQQHANELAEQVRQLPYE